MIQKEFLLSVTRKLHVIPDQFCSDVSAEKLNAYARSHGWKKDKKRIYVMYNIWTKLRTKDPVIHFELWIPRENTMEAHGKYISDVLSILSLEESRPGIDILLELLDIQE